MTWSVHKFGGTSMAGPERIAHVAGLATAALSNGATGIDVAVVVSAMAGVTNALFALCDKAAARDVSWQTDLQALVDRHVATAQALVGDDVVRTRLHGAFTSDGATIADLLRARADCGRGSGAAAAWVTAQLARPRDELDPPPLLTGSDLLAAGVPAGRTMGEMLARLRSMQLDGQIVTREAALEWVK